MSLYYIDRKEVFSLTNIFAPAAGSAAEEAYQRFMDYFYQSLQVDKSSLAQLNPSSVSELSDVFELKESKEFLSHLFNSQTLILTSDSDYDVDGICSAVVLTAGCNLLGIGKKINTYVPKGDLGYGLTPEAVKELLDEFPDTQVLITTDNGVAAFSGVQAAKDAGLCVLVTDHHEGPLERVNADVVVDPNQQGDESSFKGLCGTAVIWKLLRKYAEVVCPEKLVWMDRLLVFVGMATVSDMMPMIGENRFFVRTACQLMNQTGLLSQTAKDAGNQGWSLYSQAFAGLDVFLTVLREKGLIKGLIDSDTFGFVLGPMLNAQRRMLGTPETAFRLFQSENDDERYALVRRLIQVNNDRKKVTSKLSSSLKNDNQFVVDVASTVNGLAGLIASNLTKKSADIAMVFATDDVNAMDSYLGVTTKQAEIFNASDPYLRASARATAGYHLFELLTQISKTNPDVLESDKFGGHDGACGLSVRWSKLPEFKRLFDYYAAQSTPDDFSQSLLPIDPLQWSNDELNGVMRAVEEWQQWGPFGQGFKYPLVRVGINPTISAFRFIGSDQQHVKWSLNRLDVLAWSESDELERQLSGCCNQIIVIGKLGINEWNGQKTLQLIAESVKYV